MIKYFQLKKRPDGRGDEFYYREKSTSRDNKALVDRYISKKRSILIAGDSDSGKTHGLMKMYRSAGDVWLKKPPPVLLSSVNPLQQWVEQLPVIRFAESKGLAWSSLKQYQRVELLSEYCSEKRPVVFLDDAHKLQGRKLQIAKRCLLGNVSVITTSGLNRLPPTIRSIVDYQNPQQFTLNTAVAFDATAAMSWIFVVILFAGGFPEAALLAGGFNMLATGRRGSSNTA